MIYALITDGIVSNIAEADPDVIAAATGLVAVAITGATPSIGDLWNGSVFSAPPVVIGPITPRQIRMGLFLNGITMEMVSTALSSLPDPQKSLALISWEYGSYFERDNELVGQVAQMLGWNDAQLDALWLFAASL
jgi:hypothetical protein